MSLLPKSQTEVKGFLVGCAIGLGLAILYAHCVGCTPQQAAQFASEAPRIAGAACKALDGPASNPFVHFVCRLIDGAIDTRNMSIGGSHGSIEVEPRTVTIEVIVPREQAKDFARKNGGSL